MKEKIQLKRISEGRIKKQVSPSLLARHYQNAVSFSVPVDSQKSLPYSNPGFKGKKATNQYINNALQSLPSLAYIPSNSKYVCPIYLLSDTLNAFTQ